MPQGSVDVMEAGVVMRPNVREVRTVYSVYILHIVVFIAPYIQSIILICYHKTTYKYHVLL